MQRWYSEGAAEFFASAGFATDGSVSIGRPAQHRAGELYLERDVQVSELLDPEAYEKNRKDGYDAFYGKSWLLFHYLTFSKERSGQLVRYLQLLAQGKNGRDAGLEAFGDVDLLEKELDAYMKRRQLAMLRLPTTMLETGPIEIRRLTAGEAAMMPVRIRSRRGVNRSQALQLLPEAREVAARFPDDPAVLSALAEAEHDAGNDQESIAAADAAISKDPSQVNAYIQKGLSLFRLAEADSDAGAAYARARAPFIALNRLENDHPLPLLFYYRSLIGAGIEPTSIAKDGLHRAVELAPFDMGLRMTLATQLIGDRDLTDARRNLVPIAYNPHGGGLAAAAQRLIARIDSDPAWDGADIATLVATENEKEGAAETQ